MQNEVVPDYSKSWRQYTFVAFDTETTGKYPLQADICEVAAVKWSSGKIVETFQSFCKPRDLMGQQVINIHQITNEMVANAPNIKDILPPFNKFIEGSTLIAHQASFDLGFLTFEYEKLGMCLPESFAICSSLLARKVVPESVNHRLSTLASHFGVRQAQAHRALDDSKVCLEVAIRCMQQVGQEAPLSEIFKKMGGAFQWQRFSVSELEKNSAFLPLVAASKEKLVVELVYTGGTSPGVPRRATALGLVRNPDGDFFVGLCHKENVEKRFYLNRVLSAKILD